MAVQTVSTLVANSSIDLDALLREWYIKYPQIKPHPALVWHDTLHALIGAPPTWTGEVQVAILQYVFVTLRANASLKREGARAHIGSVVNQLKRDKAYDFISEEELTLRMSASVRILRAVGLDNII